MRMVEWYARVGEYLEAEITIDDQTYYSRPWTVRKV